MINKVFFQLQTVIVEKRTSVQMEPVLVNIMEAVVSCFFLCVYVCVLGLIFI